jgi:hypothetical protein
MLRARFEDLFKAIHGKEYAKANKILVNTKLDRTDRFVQGYMTAIAAMIRAREANDDRYFIGRIGESERDYTKARALIQETRRAHILSDSDTGYFSAWQDYLDVIANSGLLPKELEGEKGAEQHPGEEPAEEKATDSL